MVVQGNLTLLNGGMPDSTYISHSARKMKHELLKGLYHAKLVGSSSCVVAQTCRRDPEPIGEAVSFFR